MNPESQKLSGFMSYVGSYIKKYITIRLQKGEAYIGEAAVLVIPLINAYF